VGRSFDAIFEEQVDALVRLSAARREGDGLSAGSERGTLQFFAALTRAYRESYRIAADAVHAAFPGDETSDRKALVRLALDRGRAAFLASRIAHREALSKATLENAVEWLVQQGALVEEGPGMRLSPEWRSGRLSEHLAVLDLLLR
jgi:glycerol-3-phosphate O-acyltransferase